MRVVLFVVVAVLLVGWLAACFHHQQAVTYEPALSTSPYK
jgi:hypothetical protein